MYAMRYKYENTWIQLMTQESDDRRPSDKAASRKPPAEMAGAPTDEDLRLWESLATESAIEALSDERKRRILDVILSRIKEEKTKEATPDVTSTPVRPKGEDNERVLGIIHSILEEV